MNTAQLILIDKRNQPLKDYIVAVAASDGLDIKGVQIIASPAKGEKALLTAGLRIPPLEDFDFDTRKIAQHTLDQLLIDEQLVSCDQFISQASQDETVCTNLQKSKHKLALAIEALISEFTQSSVTDLIRDNRNDALYKLKQQAKELNNKTILCLDIEATDISTNLEADILQLSVCDLEGNEKLNQLYNPGYPIPPNEKHAITTEMVADAPKIEDCWPEIHALLQQADIILAYSTESDFSYLKNSAEKKQLPFELDYAKWLDVAELSKELVGAMRWHSERMHWFWKTPKLTMAYERILNKPFPGDAHDALADARATAELMQTMLKLGAKSDIKAKEPPKTDAKVSNNLFAMAFAKAKKK
ncbi:3'-5' exonuclease [Thiomicrospira cyclica]|uniref:Exonuclease RNase T and DNA polymerase III n=1 Tax=Thiomicrospira cyclica (strain DSM 14477 / JCM 11371 / ALM1) TaxID=717773 RepID=F6DAH3_THICA|nr:3'-5' exonuclease [Thiomicrospira cyclica]AEG32229.1 Exonuclease RNase T and DNA polymerase III [Thiomicrospira cyclica ALM1]